MDRLDEFRLKLADLMEQYSVEIEAKDVYPGYPECGTDIRILLCYNGEFTKKGYSQCRKVELSKCLDVDTVRGI